MVSGARNEMKALSQGLRITGQRRMRPQKETCIIGSSIGLFLADHTKVPYNNLIRPKAAILAQMRTGKCKLRPCLHPIGAEDSYRCGCEQKEEKDSEAGCA